MAKSTSRRNAFVTGASSGIGLALVRELVLRGWRVALAARDLEAMKHFVSVIDPGGDRTFVQRLDVSDHGSIAPALAAAASELGGLDAVVANAGTGRPGLARELTPAHMKSVFDVNLIGAAETLIAAIPHVADSPRALLAGVSSLAAYRGGPGSGAYNATKAALTSFLESLRAELSDEGIRVLDIRPGFVKTPMTDRNDFEMPFLMEPAAAAVRIADAIERRKSHVTLPRRAGWVMSMIRHMPDGLFDCMARWVTRRFRKQGKLDP